MIAMDNFFLGLLLYVVITTDLVPLGCYLFVKTRNEWRK